MTTVKMPNNVGCFGIVKFGKHPVCRVDKITEQPTLCQFSRPSNIHPSTHPSFHALLRSFCQTVRKGCVSFAFICYPQDTKCCQPAVVCSVSHLLSCSPSLPLSFLCLSVCLFPTPLERQQTGVAGEETDGKDDRKNFWGKK